MNFLKWRSHNKVIIKHQKLQAHKNLKNCKRPHLQLSTVEYISGLLFKSTTISSSTSSNFPDLFVLTQYVCKEIVLSGQLTVQISCPTITLSITSYFHTTFYYKGICLLLLFVKAIFVTVFVIFLSDGI